MSLEDETCNHAIMQRKPRKLASSPLLKIRSLSPSPPSSHQPQHTSSDTTNPSSTYYHPDHFISIPFFLPSKRNTDRPWHIQSILSRLVPTPCLLPEPSIHTSSSTIIHAYLFFCTHTHTHTHYSTQDNTTMGEKPISEKFKVCLPPCPLPSPSPFPRPLPQHTHIHTHTRTHQYRHLSPASTRLCVRNDLMKMPYMQSIRSQKT